MAVGTLMALTLGIAGGLAASSVLGRGGGGGTATAPPPIPRLDPGEAQRSAQEAARRQHKRAAAGGRRSTILGGFRAAGRPQTRPATLLGRAVNE